MMEAAPAAAFEVIEPDLLLQFTVISLDSPAQFGQSDQGVQARLLGQRGQPVFGRSLFAIRPLDQQPLLGPGFVAGIVPVCRPNPARGKARLQLASAALAPS